MHPRNPYNKPPDFTELARRYPPLRPYVFINHTGSSTINFKSLPAQKCLTEALFRLDYGLSLTLPDDRLCPPVPNRLNYVLWLQDIVKFTCSSATVRGLDIGTGASAIYPLLACGIEHTWNFVATDIDERSVQFAKQNVSQNSMDNRIFVERVQADGPILQPLHTSLMNFDFTMCNPPFYSSAEDVSRSAEFKEFGPNAVRKTVSTHVREFNQLIQVCSGAQVEMITPGGETSFVARIFSESLQLRTKCRWYTSMLGKMSSIPDLVSLFREHSVDNYVITEFVQGQTRRWAIGWSFQDARVPDTFARVSNPTLRNIMPSRNTLHHAFPGARSANILASALRNVLVLISGVTVTSSATPAIYDHSSTILVHARSNTWSRAARRGKLQETVCADQDLPVLRCSVECRQHTSSYTSGDIACELLFTWVEGKDRLIFESFTSHVSHKITSSLKEFGDVK